MNGKMMGKYKDAGSIPRQRASKRDIFEPNYDSSKLIRNAEKRWWRKDWLDNEN